MPDIACGLCPCQFDAAEFEEDELMCRFCGHSLDDDHVAVDGLESTPADLPVAKVI